MADILKVFSVNHGDILQRTFRATHGLVPQVIKIFRSLCGSAPLRIKTFRVVHDQARSFVKIFRVLHQQSTFIQKVFRVLHQQQDGVVLRVFRAVNGHVAGSAIMKIFRAIHGQATDTFQDDDFDVSLSVGGQPVLSWSDASLTNDEGRFAWEGQVTVHSSWDGETLLGQFDPVVYSRYGTDYNLIVADRAMASSIAADKYSLLWVVKLASPAYLLAAGLSLPVTKTWPRGTAAKSIVQELCDLKSINLDWQAPEYVIGELSVEKQSPMDIIKTVLNIVGALPQSAADGSLVVRKETPAMPVDGAVTAASFAALFINQISEQPDDPAVLYNAVQVSDSAETEGGLQHTETDRTDGGKDIKAWAEPWGAVSLRVNSAGGETTLSSGLLVTEDHLLDDGEPEWLQFVDGKATATRPILQGFSVVAVRGDDPGSVTWQPDSKELVASGGGEYYVQVAYQWRYYAFTYYSITGYDYQLVLTDG